MDLVLILVLGLVVGLAVGMYLGRSAGVARLAGQDVAVEMLERQVAQLETQLTTSRRDEQGEAQVLQTLAPVRESLLAMQQTVVDLERQRHTQHGQLAEQLLHTRTTAEQSRVAAESLASAMRNNVTRGVWGETQLRRLVESAGLLNRVDFSLQTTVTAETGRRRPDMVLHLPGGKAVAVDAKVPVAAYLEAHAADEGSREVLLDRHAAQVRAHVDALAAKQYWTGLDVSPEFTIAFIPSEPVLAAALERDPSLLEHAFAQRIAVASPVSLWAVLKTVAFTWQQDALTDDAKVLFDLGKELYGRLGTMADHVEKLRRSLASTVDSYNKFASSLETRVLVTARKLDALDDSSAPGESRLPEPGLVEVEPRSLIQPELDPDVARSGW